MHLLVAAVALTVLGSRVAGAQPSQEPAADPTRAAYPRIAMMWAPVRGDRSLESFARHDLIMAGSGALGLQYDGAPRGLADRFTDESVRTAKDRIAAYRRLKPDVLVIGDLLFYEYPDRWLPEDHPWWLRKEGKRVQFWPGTHRMNWHLPDYRRHVVRQTVALK